MSPEDDLLADLRAEANKPALILLANFETYMESIGGFEEQISLLPDEVGLLIDAMAYPLSSAFMKEHGLNPKEPLYPGGSELGEALAFFLKVAWDRGYFLYKFHRFDHVPRVSAPVDPLRIMDAIMAGTSPDQPNLAAGIDAILQRAVSLSTEEKPMRRTLRLIDAAPVRKVEGYLDEWSVVVRKAYGWGILAAKAEVALTARVG